MKRKFTERKAKIGAHYGYAMAIYFATKQEKKEFEEALEIAFRGVPNYGVMNYQADMSEEDTDNLIKQFFGRL